MNSSNSKCKYFRISGVPAGSFGESYLLITTKVESMQLCWWEYYIISKRMNPSLQKMSHEYETPTDLPESLKIDICYLLDEAKQEAQYFLEDKLVEIYEKAGKPLSPTTGIELVEISQNPLHSLWFRDQLRDEIGLISQSTKSPDLKPYLELLVKSSFLRRTE